MQAKALEVRDSGTFIPVLAVDMNPRAAYPQNGTLTVDELRAGCEASYAQGYLLARCGYACDGAPNILLTRLDGNGQATNDPWGWKGGARTFPVAHEWIIDHWHELKDGDVVDVQFIAGETAAPKVSERVSEAA